jgi:hypothetical protein
MSIFGDTWRSFGSAIFVLRRFRKSTTGVQMFSKKMLSKNPRRNPPRHTPEKNTKLTGEGSEAAFLNRAAALGFGVAKPWGDSLRYDFILDNGDRL